MEVILSIAFSVLAWIGFTISGQLLEITKEVRELRLEVHRRLAPHSSFNSSYEDSNIHDMLAGIHRVVTK